MTEYVKKPKPKPEDYDWIREQLKTQRITMIRGFMLATIVRTSVDQTFEVNADKQVCISLAIPFGNLVIPLARIKEIRISALDVILHLH